MTLIRFLRTLVALAAGNLRASRGQAAYLILTLAITTAAWLVLTGLAAPAVADSATRSSDIIVRNGSQGSSALPLKYARRIEAIRGAGAVLWYGLQPVNCTAATMVTLNALGGTGTAAYARKQKVPAAVFRRWRTDPLGAVVSADALAKCGWQVGQGVDPPSVMDGKHVELHIVGSFPATSPLGLVHYDYINRAAPGLQGMDKVVTYLVSAVDPRDAEVLAARIEAEFAHDFPSVSATTNATEQNAWARFGKVQQLLAFVIAAMLLCAASVFISVLAHGAAQRRSRLALLQVLGFQRAMLFAAFVLELLASVIVGALLGIGLAKLAAHVIAPTTIGFLSGGVHAPVWAWWGLPAWLAVLVAAALAWPAGLIARVRPADYRAT